MPLIILRCLQVRLELRQAILLVHEDAQHFLQWSRVLAFPTSVDLRSGLAVDEAGEARQGLLAAPSHTHQQRTAAGVRGDAADAFDKQHTFTSPQLFGVMLAVLIADRTTTDVEHCIVEEHQVHRRMFRVVGCQLRLQSRVPLALKTWPEQTHRAVLLKFN